MIILLELLQKIGKYLVTRSLRSRVGGGVVHFSGFARKMNHLFCFLRERS
ncbi:MAG: hypothetical protein U5L45_08155 [Saprospiraceae bacterium]|nr:hypothetical protein [Saprospiraceae bacterium]